MSVLDEETITRIKSLLKRHPKGMMISDLSSHMKINRNIMSKYLDILLMSGHVEMEVRGNAKVFSLSRRTSVTDMFEFSSDYVIVLDGREKILWVNSPLLLLLDKNPADFAGRSLREIEDPFFRSLPHGENPETGNDLPEVCCRIKTESRYFRVKQTPAVLTDGSTGSILTCEDITKERIFQQMADLSETRFQAIVEDQTEFITRFLPDGTLTFVNGSYARSVGKIPEELIGTPCFLCIPEENRALFREQIRTLDMDHAVKTIESRIPSANGCIRRQQWTIRALFDKKGTIREYQGVGRDITEQAEAEERLRLHAVDMEFIAKKIRMFMELPAGSDIYAAIAEGLSELLPDAVIAVSSIVPNPTDPGSQTLTIRNVCGIGGRELFLQISGIDLVGFTYSFNDPAAIDYIKMKGLHKAYGDLYACLFGQVPYLVCRQIEEAINVGETHIHALVSQGHLIGEVAIYSRKGKSIPNPGLVEAFLQQASLVLAWRKTGEDLQKSEEQLRAIVEEQTEFITRFLPDGTLTFVNGSYARSVGKKPEELIGTQYFVQFFSDDVPLFKEKILSLEGDQADATIEYRVPDNCGTRRQQWTVRALFDKERNLTEYLGVGRDITEQAETGDRIRRHAADMDFISRKAREFLELLSEADIYAAIADGLSELLPEAAICVNSFDPVTQALTVRNACGIRARETFRQITGDDIVGFSFVVNDPTAIEFIKKEGLHKAYGDLYTGLFGQVPYLVCRRIEEALNIGEIFILGLISQGQLLGNATILPRNRSPIPNPGLIEAFLQQASLVLAWRKADDALRKNEARFRAIVEDQTEFITRFLPDGSLTYVNRSYSRYMGKEPGDLTGQPHIPYIVNEVIPLFRQRFPGSDPNNLVTTIQCRVLTQAGSIRWQQWTVRALCDEKGEITEYQGVGRDITELHEAEESTRQHIADMEFLSRKAREFLELSPGADIYKAILNGLRELAPESTMTISSFDPRSSAITVRSVWCEEVGTLFKKLTGEDLIGKAFPVSDPEAIMNLKAGRILRIPGNVYSVMFGAVPITHSQQIEKTFGMGGDKFAIGLVSQDKPLGAVLIVPKEGQALVRRNLIETFLKQASIALAQRLDAEALRQSEARFRAVIEEQTDFITRFLPDGTLTFVNAPLCRVIKKDSPGLLGRSFFRMIPDEDRQMLEISLKTLTAENPKTTIEHRISVPGEEPRWIRWTNRAIFDDQGHVTEYDGIGRDITELHEASVNTRQHFNDMQFLARSAREVIQIKSSDGVYRFVSENLRELVPGSLVAIMSFNRPRGMLQIRRVDGDQKSVRILNTELHRDLAGMSFSLDGNHEHATLLSGQHLVPGPTLPGWMTGSITKETCARVSELLNLGRAYVMSLSSFDGTNDSVIIQLEAGTDISNRELVETFVSQSAIALACRQE